MLKHYLITFWGADGKDVCSIELISEPCKLSETVNDWFFRHPGKTKRAIAWEYRELEEP